MINKNKELFVETDMLNSELDRMHQRYATLEDQILVLTNDNQRLKDAAAVNKLHVKELNDHLNHLQQEIQIKNKQIEDYEDDIG